MVEFGTQGEEIRGDKQLDTTTHMLKKLVHEDQFNAFCIDCQKNRSTHANISFGVFICQDCAKFHMANFPMYESYIKNVFDECWDKFQLAKIWLRYPNYLLETLWRKLFHRLGKTLRYR